jgi:sterol desaturase/sphingolipid hydroxylase (fatty acid hydroxylase superfamily)
MIHFREIVIDSTFFLVFSMVLFVPVELLLPARKAHRAPVSDWLHFWANSVIVPLSALTLMAFIGGTVRASLPSAFTGGLGRWPLGEQLLLTVILAELWSYWAHRIAHAVPFLWRFHQVHHSIEHMTWVSALRQHPFDAIWIMAGANIPAFAMGVDLRPLASFIFIERCYTILLHSNIDFSYGWCDRIFASTRFHHWHHDRGLEGRDKNFAGMFSLLDWLFGTYQPTEKSVQVMGLDRKSPPPNYWSQLLWPFIQK